MSLPDPSNATERLPPFSISGVVAALAIAGVLALIALVALDTRAGGRPPDSGLVPLERVGHEEREGVGDARVGFELVVRAVGADRGIVDVRLHPAGEVHGGGVGAFRLAMRSMMEFR